MYRRRLKPALDQRDVQELVAAELFAEQRGKKLNTVITIHPKLIDKQPADIGLRVSWLTNKVRIFCERDRKFGYFASWIRECYDGEDREHLHIVMYVPKRHRADLEASLRRWLRGDPRAIKLTEPEYDHKQRDRFDRPINKALTYSLETDDDPGTLCAESSRVERPSRTPLWTTTSLALRSCGRAERAHRNGVPA